jgi:hypothetical protein
MRINGTSSCFGPIDVIGYPSKIAVESCSERRIGLVGEYDSIVVIIIVFMIIISSSVTIVLSTVPLARIHNVPFPTREVGGRIVIVVTTGKVVFGRFPK